MSNINTLHKNLNKNTGEISLIGESELGYHFGTQDCESSAPNWDQVPFSCTTDALKGETSHINSKNLIAH